MAWCKQSVFSPFSLLDQEPFFFFVLEPLFAGQVSFFQKKDE
jgi:hypothetical protein